jgi:hypothetical protein
MAPEKPPYRVRDGVALVDLRLLRVGQLFASLDPSPFRERELDASAEEWIVESFRELGRPFRLVIHLPDDVPYDEGQVREALHHHFRYRLWSTNRRWEHFRRDGWTKLAIGLGFLLLCLLLRQLVHGATTLAAGVLDEGLLILGWVAMWGPVEALLYEWWPIRRDAAMYRTLSGIEVEIRSVSRENTRV